MGLRDGRLAAMVLMQILMLGALSGLVGVALGVGMALLAGSLAADRLPVALLLSSLWSPALFAWCFGLLTALVFSLPPLARALSVTPAVLFRGDAAPVLSTPRRASAWMCWVG
jgi:putative ABC transport system permease protein